MPKEYIHFAKTWKQTGEFVFHRSILKLLHLSKLDEDVTAQVPFSNDYILEKLIVLCLFVSLTARKKNSIWSLLRQNFLLL